MEANQQAPIETTTPVSRRSSFTPGSVSFLAGVLLFLMPFVDIKCGDTTIKSVKGFELATGFTVEDKNMSKSIFGNLGSDQAETKSKSEKRDPDMYALAALGLGILGLIVSFLAKGRSVIAALMGVLASVALIVSMINIKGDSKLQSASNTKNDLGDFGSGFGNDIMRVEFTAWFYIAIVLFLLAAFLNWRTKTKQT
jgi:hypothetical protein